MRPYRAQDGAIQEAKAAGAPGNGLPRGAYRFVWVCVLPCLLFAAPQALAQTAPETAKPDFVAGLEPDRRPAGQPTIDKVVRPEGWRKQALRGVSEPIPESLNFLDNQGAWYTPFRKPGMDGRYDIRGLHAAPN